MKRFFSILWLGMMLGSVGLARAQTPFRSEPKQEIRLVPLQGPPKVPMMSNDLIDVRERQKRYRWPLFKTLEFEEGAPTRWFVVDPETGRWWEAEVPQGWEDEDWKNADPVVEDPEQSLGALLPKPLIV